MLRKQPTQVMTGAHARQSDFRSTERCGNPLAVIRTHCFLSACHPICYPANAVCHNFRPTMAYHLRRNHCISRDTPTIGMPRGLHSLVVIVYNEMTSYCSLIIPSKHETLAQCWFIVGSASQTLAQL